MPDKHCCIAVYSEPTTICNAIEQLHAGDIATDRISLLCSLAESAVNSNENLPAHWQQLCNTLKNCRQITVPDWGTLLAAGPVASLVTAIANDDSFGGSLDSRLGVAGAALYKLGTPVENIRQYQSAIKQGNCLLIVDGDRHQVESACGYILENNQHVTIHAA